MAKVLLIGSHPERTRYAVRRLRGEGWQVRGVVGPDAGMAAIEGITEVDAVVLGGPSVLEELPALRQTLNQRHPHAKLVIAYRPDRISDDIVTAMGGEAQ
jgi:hypothetical protein